jgi:hypothetical protein
MAPPTAPNAAMPMNKSLDVDLITQPSDPWDSNP